MAQDQSENTPSKHEGDVPAGHSVVDANPAPPDAGKTEPPKPRHRLRWIVIGAAVAAVAVGLFLSRAWIYDYFTTVWTDDAYVSSHVTYLSARVGDSVTEVYVDDTQRVSKGDLLLELDHEPYQIAVAQKQAALAVAESNLTAAKAQVRAQEAQARAGWYSLVNAQEQVRFQIATLNSNVAQWKLEQANLNLAEKEIDRVRRLARQQAAPKEELDQRAATFEVSKQRVADAQQTIRKTRAALGLPPDDQHPTRVPEDLDQKFSAVQTALSNVAQALATIGVPLRLYGLTPETLHRQLIDKDPDGDLNRTLDRFVEKAPAVLQARATRDQAREDLRNAELNLRYTYVYAPIDGQVMRRTVNPGNNVAVGQALMSIRSLKDVWIDANFKENQIADLRIGQPVRIRVDAYPDRTFHGRVEGFSAGTGSSLALIPPENATGNFIKIVQRLPVRITFDPGELTDETPMWIGLSTVPTVEVRKEPAGPDAGKRLLSPIQRRTPDAAPVSPRQYPKSPSVGQTEAGKP